MPTRTKNQNTLALGDWNAICDVCGFKFKASDLKKRWDGYMVCEDDWERRHESDFFRAPVDNQSVPWNRVDNTPEQSTYTDVAGNSVSTDTGVDTSADHADGTRYVGTDHTIQIITSTDHYTIVLFNDDPNVVQGSSFILYWVNGTASGKLRGISLRNPISNIYAEVAPADGAPPIRIVVEYDGTLWRIVKNEVLPL